MKFFKIREAVENIGLREVVPLWEYNTEAINSQSKLSYNHFPQIEPQFSRLLVTGPLTDVLADGGAIGGMGFIINNNLKNLFLQFNFDRHQFYPLSTFDYNSNERVTINYYWLQIIRSDFYSWIDYELSEIFIFDDFEEEIINKLDIKSSGGLVEAINSTLETDYSILYKKLIFNQNYMKYNFDIFFLDKLSDNLFSYPIISERLKNKLEQNKINGLEFKEVPIHLIKDLV